MQPRWITRGVPLAVAAGLIVAVGVWLSTGSAYQLGPRLPGADRAHLSDEEAALAGLEPRLVRYDASAPDWPGSWPAFRGPDLTNISREAVPLARSWPDEGPPKLWQIELGEGYASAAIHEGRVYVLDYDPPDVWTFTSEDVLDWPGLAKALAGGEATGSPGPAKRVWDRLGDGGRASVRTLADAAGAKDETARTAVLEALNALLADWEFFDQAAFEGVDLPGEHRRYLATFEPQEEGGRPEMRLKKGVDERNLPRLNRMLIVSSWPELLKRRRHGDCLRCLSLADGRDLWRYYYNVKVKRQHGFSRTTPAVADGCVVSLGPKAHVTCLDAATGELKWSVDLVREYGTEVPKWNAGQCPVIEDGRVILAPAGKDVLMAALDLATGETLWETPNPDEWDMTHVSVTPMELGGVRMYVYNGSGGVAGVDAASGTPLWMTDLWRVRVPAASPLPLPGGRLLLSAGYGAGSMVIRVRRQGDAFTVDEEPLFEGGPKDLGSVQHTPIFFENHVFGMLPTDAGGLSSQMVCLDLEMNHVWRSGSDWQFGGGPYVIADGLLFIMNDEGRLTVAEATPEAWRPLDSALIFENGHEAWGPIAIAGGRMIVRDTMRMACLDIRAAAVKGGGS